MQAPEENEDLSPPLSLFRAFAPSQSPSQSPSPTPPTHVPPPRRGIITASELPTRTGRWTPGEHSRFLEGVQVSGGVEGELYGIYMYL